MRRPKKIESVCSCYYLQVYNHQTNKSIGHVYEISPYNMRLLSYKKFNYGSKFWLRIHIPDYYLFHNPLILPAINTECKEYIPRLYACNFIFSMRTRENITPVKTLIKDVFKRAA